MEKSIKITFSVIGTIFFGILFWGNCNYLGLAGALQNMAPLVGAFLAFFVLTYGLLRFSKYWDARRLRHPLPTVPPSEGIGFTKSGMAIIGLITFILLELSHYVLKEYGVIGQAETAMVGIRLGILFLFLTMGGFIIFATDSARRANDPQTNDQVEGAAASIHAVTKFIGMIVFPLVAYFVPKDAFSLNLFSVIFLISAYSARYKNWTNKLLMIAVVVTIALCVRFILPPELQKIGQYVLPALMFIEAGRMALFGMGPRSTKEETATPDGQESLFTTSNGK